MAAKAGAALGIVCITGLLCFCGVDESSKAPSPTAPSLQVQLAPSAIREAGIVSEPAKASMVQPTLVLTGTLAAKPWTPEEQAAISAADGADAKARLADANFRRLSKLYEDGITARQDLDAARADRDQAQAAAVQADAQRDNLGLSSRSGSLERQAPIWGLANLSDVDLARVRAGAAVSTATAAYPGASFPGKVADISRSEDPDTRTFTVRIAVENSGGGLRPQMLATFSIAAPDLAGITVPRSAVLLEGDGSYVYVARGNVFRKQRIQTGVTAGDRIQVTAGISAGTPVVTHGAQRLESERLKAQYPSTEED